MHLPLPCTSFVAYFVFNSNGINLSLGFSYCMIEYNHVSCLLDRRVRIWMKRRKNWGPRMFLGGLFRQKRNSKFLKMHQGMPIAVIFCSLCVWIIAWPVYAVLFQGLKTIWWCAYFKLVGVLNLLWIRSIIES